MIRMQKALWLLLVSAAVVLSTGCNDTLRQFITPVPGPGGDPGALAHAIVLSTNPATPSTGVALGSDLHIDVSGDTVVGVVNIGQNPVFLGKNSNRVFVLNGDGTATSYIGLLPLSSTISTMTLPSGSIPKAGSFSSSGNFYAADGTNVDVLSPTSLAFTGSLTAGTTPVMVAANGSNNKIYVVNQGDGVNPGSVTAISTIDNVPVANITTGIGVNPIWGVMSSDGVHVFVVNQGNGTSPGSVSVIDTFLDIVIATIDVGVSPNYAIFEPHLQRVYVSNTGSPFISVIKANGIDLANQILPTLLANIPIPAPATSVAALQDGSRAYAALGGCTAGTNHTNLLPKVAPGSTDCLGNQVAVIDSSALALKKVLTVGAGAVSIDAANSSARVYVVGAHDRNVSIIRTSDDSVLTTFAAPQASLGCQSKVACPGTDAQIPFMVRVFP